MTMTPNRDALLKDIYKLLVADYAASPDSGEVVTDDVRPLFVRLCDEMARAASAPDAGKAVAWECRPARSPADGRIYTDNPWAWRPCSEREFRERSFGGSDKGDFEFRELYAAPAGERVTDAPAFRSAQSDEGDWTCEIRYKGQVLLIDATDSGFGVAEYQDGKFVALEVAERVRGEL